MFYCASICPLRKSTCSSGPCYCSVCLRVCNLTLQPQTVGQGTLYNINSVESLVAPVSSLLTCYVLTPWPYFYTENIRSHHLRTEATTFGLVNSKYLFWQGSQSDPHWYTVCTHFLGCVRIILKRKRGLGPPFCRLVCVHRPTMGLPKGLIFSLLFFRRRTQRIY